MVSRCKPGPTALLPVFCHPHRLSEAGRSTPGHWDLERKELPNCTQRGEKPSQPHGHPESTDTALREPGPTGKATSRTETQEYSRSKKKRPSRSGCRPQTGRQAWSHPDKGCPSESQDHLNSAPSKTWLKT